MSDVTETGVETAQVDQTEMNDLLAGYNARSGNTLPAEVPNPSSEQPVIDPAKEVPTNTQGDLPTDPPVAEPKDQVQLLRDQMAAFKEEVRALASGDPAAVRKLHGEIGDINRKLKQLEPKPAPAVAPVDEELAAAMQGAEKVGEEFQELGGPLVTALKAVAKSAAARPVEQPGMTQEQINEQIEARAKQMLEEAEQRAYNEAVIVLKADHPDFATVKDSPEFATWLKAKPAELQDVITHTDNPVLAGRYLTEFKESQRVQQKKQGRLASAVTPTGVPAPAATQSKLTADEEVALGYNRFASKNGFRSTSKR